MRAVAAIALLATLFAGNAFAQQQHEVTLDVHFQLTDPDYKPLRNVAARVVFGSEAAWQSANAGTRVTTDAKGESRFERKVTLDRRAKKMPTNFVDSLLRGKQPVEHLAAGVELEYAGERFLYVIDIDRFPDDTVLLDGTSLFARDAQGNYTRKVADNHGWEAWHFLLVPETADRWRLDLALLRRPDPVRH